MALPQQIVDGIGKLDPLPRTVQELMAASADEDVSFNDLAAIVERDEAIASNVLRFVNSSASGATRTIDSVRQAVVRVGLARLNEIVLGFQVKAMNCDAAMYDLTEHEMWRHSVAAATAARTIREHSSVAIPDSVATAALVHDIGKLIMVRQLDVEVDQLVTFCDEQDATWIEAEREICGCDHAQVGEAMAQAWSFPEPIREAIARHHDSPMQDPTPLLDAVVLANFVCRTIGIGLGAAGLNLDVDQEALGRLGLDYEAFCLICAETAAEVQTI